MLIDISMATAAVPAAPVLTGPALTGPALTGPVLTGPVLTGPVLTGPALTGPALTGPVPTGPALTGPLASGAASARMRPSAGATVRCDRRTWLLGSAEVAGQNALLAGRQASGEAAFFGSCNHAAGLAQFAMQQRTSKKCLHSTKMYARPTTRNTATSGGAQGPHPARDPV